MADEISVEDLNGRFKNAVLTVKAHQNKGVDAGHPYHPDDDLGSYIVTYTGKCLGTRVDQGIESLILETTVGRKDLMAIHLDKVEDISLAADVKIPAFAGLEIEKNPLS